MSEPYGPQRFSPSESKSDVMEFRDDGGVDDVDALVANVENRTRSMRAHDNG
jgi:hypothetical protein